MALFINKDIGAGKDWNGDDYGPALHEVPHGLALSKRADQFMASNQWPDYDLFPLVDIPSFYSTWNPI